MRKQKRPVSSTPEAVETTLPPRRPLLVYATTDALTMNTCLEGQLRFMNENGFRVVAMTSPGQSLQTVQKSQGVRTVPTPMRREISPLADLLALARLIRRLWRLKPDIVNAGTPKAGLLVMLSAWIVGVPVRLYVLHGLRLETSRGLRRQLLKWCERLSSACAHAVICVSESVRREYGRLGVAAPDKLVVAGYGSANGIDLAKFELTEERQREVGHLKRSLGLAGSCPVIGFVGRFTRDKGITVLVHAYDILLSSFPDLRLLMLGDFDDTDPVAPDTARRLREDDRIVLAGFVRSVAPYYHLMDILVLPSYREGFPTAPLEAAAAGLPVAAFRATGSVDAVQDGITGRLVEPGNVEGLAGALKEYLNDPELRRRHGQAGKARVARFFTNRIVWTALREEYAKRLAASKTSGSLPYRS